MSRGALLSLLACALLALGLAACGDDGDSTGGTEGSATATAGEEASPAGDEGTESGEAGDSNGGKPAVEVPSGDPPGELVTEELVEGDGAEAEQGDEVTVQYVGVGYQSGEEFDSSWDRGEPFSFTLGNRRVIPGWERGVEGMKEGGRRELIIPPNLAYGQEGVPPAIGPDETLVFVVDLVSVG